MMMFDTRDRWVYKGSVTSPPCATAVYWNVLRRVYPMKQRHLDLFKKQLHRDHLNSNHRVLNPVNTHDLHIITSGSSTTTENVNDTLKSVLGVFICLTVAMGIILVFQNAKLANVDEENTPTKDKDALAKKLQKLKD
jgi:hypothetical protein